MYSHSQNCPESTSESTFQLNNLVKNIKHNEFKLQNFF